ncbi:MAG TPA: sigma-70 family RNA polymerase sigma factor, partial [Candidatus Saccharimonas sp.]|nr:sigma-70 family RNA polymerase sigma factor [Candidatus Saccharimonas sp.]
HYKSGRYRLEVATADVLQLSDAAAKYSEHDDPAVAVMAAITSAELRRAMAELSESQRECLTLRVFKGYSVAETAQRMGKEEGAVKALQYRAVRALARLLPPDFIARPALARS